MDELSWAVQLISFRLQGDRKMATLKRYNQLTITKTVWILHDSVCHFDNKTAAAPVPPPYGLFNRFVLKFCRCWNDRLQFYLVASISSVPMGFSVSSKLGLVVVHLFAFVIVVSSLLSHPKSALLNQKFNNSFIMFRHSAAVSDEFDLWQCG